MVDSAAIDFSHCGHLEISGVVIPDDPAVITPAIEVAIRSGRFECDEAHQIPQIVRPGDNVLEIGSGIGFISTLLAREPRVSRVCAVEANPYLIDYMTRLHGQNRVRKVKRLNTVLTNEPVASKTFYIRRDFWMGSLMPGPNPYVATTEVPTANLDALLRDEQINLIVCDVEGSECSLFKDADLSGVDRIFLELHDHITGMSGVARLFSTLAVQGFVYDPRHSTGSVVLFQRIGEVDLIRPYGGK